MARNTALVAPLVGAWIEITLTTWQEVVEKVAPLVGAWIEIAKVTVKIDGWASLLSWERGLKSESEVEEWFQYESLLSWERGLK